MNTVIKPCKCKHDSQDEIHGKGNRVWNNAPGKNTEPKRYRCTVCGVEAKF